MRHFLVMKAGYEELYKDIQYSRQGFIAYNTHTKHQEGLPIDAFDLLPLSALLPELYIEVDKRVAEKVEQAIKNAATEIVDAATKLMENEVKDGNVQNVG